MSKKVKIELKKDQKKKVFIKKAFIKNILPKSHFASHFEISEIYGRFLGLW